MIGTFHLRAAEKNEDVELVAVADINEDAAKAAASEFGVAVACSSADDLIADDNIDAVVLALVTSVRSPVAIRALEQGMHVLLEKPPAMNSSELRQMMARQNSRVVACCSSRFSFLETVTKAREIVESGRLGAIRVVRCRGLSAAAPVPPGSTPPAWRVSRRLNGGGFMVNWGIYDLDYLMHATAWTLRPRTVMAQTWPIASVLAAGRIHPESDAENHVISLIRCDSGAVIVHERGEAVSMPGEQSWQICGEKGSLRSSINPLPGEPALVLDEIDVDRGMVSKVIVDEPKDLDVHQAVFNDFIASIRNGRSPATDMSRALTLQGILDSIYESANTGNPVEIQE